MVNFMLCVFYQNKKEKGKETTLSNINPLLLEFFFTLSRVPCGRLMMAAKGVSTS